MELRLALEMLIESLSGRNYSPQTIRIYFQSCGPFILYAEGKGFHEAHEITREVMEGYRIYLQGLEVCEETKAIRARCVDKFFSFLVDRGELLLSPSEGLAALPKGKRLPRVTLSIEEMKKILFKPNTSMRLGIRDRAILELLYSTGIRASELLSLKVWDIDLLTKVVLVKRAKGGRARVVPVGREALRWLKEYLTHVRPYQARKNPSERALFLMRMSSPLSRVMLGILIRKYAREARIKKKVTAHTFRHSLATHMMQRGADITSIQRILGHTDLRSTHIYTRVMPIDLKVTHRKTHPRER